MVNWLKRDFQVSEPVAKTKAKKVRNATAVPSRRGKVGMTIHLSEEAHAFMKQIAEEEDISMQSILREGLNLALVKHGKKPIA